MSKKLILILAICSISLIIGGGITTGIIIHNSNIEERRRQHEAELQYMREVAQQMEEAAAEAEREANRATWLSSIGHVTPYRLREWGEYTKENNTLLYEKDGSYYIHDIGDGGWGAIRGIHNGTAAPLDYYKKLLPTSVDRFNYYINIRGTTYYFKI